MNNVLIIGGGLAGAEAAWQLAKAGIPCVLAEMKPEKFSAAHESPNLAELVCSNSFKAERLPSAPGLLKAEMELLGSLCVLTAKECRVPAGGALAVDRDEFSRLITRRIEAEPLITVKRGEVTEIPTDGPVIVAAGPLVSDRLAGDIAGLCGGLLSFFDAAAPIVTAESVDMSSAFAASRYGRGGEDDYINCPLDKEQYEAFYRELVSAERAGVHEPDKKSVYEGCMPIEVMAKRGQDTIRFGPMKPVGLRDPETGKRPWAVLQLRKENAVGTLLNLVGFQTNLKFGEQRRVFSMIPALKNAEFVRYGVMHRNTFINSPKLLNSDFSFRAREELFFAGQITGVEGYMESASSGIVAGLNMARKIRGLEAFVPPGETMLGALCRYVSGSETADFQPMGANFGILPPLPITIRDKKQRYEMLAERSIAAYRRRD
ncbi:MAG: methylenetetrahydrofolate--tRNA-(uracil(54)-C(5))-methyltransferase (FADH(2)-oxidizing) TrmFO [Oscillospiraceae bacterium]|nr:methylenetetrahydrofolate--tRNA-(uracil(54)-C(5))-methyltransferase (FADH(2)-oxidizing) TrmFO [Oscillospiraceae bacterium]